MSDAVVFFVHVPKTAGTTMCEIIASQYAPDEILNLMGLPIEERAPRLAAMPPRTRIITGHNNANLLRYVRRATLPITLLREPIERVISLYYFLARDETAAAHEAIVSGRTSLADCARRHRNTQARFIAGYGAKEEIADDELLREATESLSNKFTAFGLCERFDESLLLLERALGWRVAGYARANVTPDRPERQVIAESDLAVLRANNRVDTVLYGFAGELFDRRFGEQFPTIDSELQRLRRGVRVAETERAWRSAAYRLARRVGLAS